MCDIQLNKKQEAHGNIAHLRKQLQSIKTNDYIVTLIKRIKKKILIFITIYCFFHLKKLESPSPKDALCQDCLILAQWFWRRSFLKFPQCIFHYFVMISPWKRAGVLIWTNLNPLHPRMHCNKFGWNWPSGSGVEFFFKISSMYFHYFVIISPWKRVGSFFWTNLNPLHPRMICSKFGWIGPMVLEKKIFKFHQCIFTIS